MSKEEKNNNGLTKKLILPVLGVLLASGIIAALTGSTASKVNDAQLQSDISHIKEEQGECKDMHKRHINIQEKLTESTHKTQEDVSVMQRDIAYISQDILEQKEIDKDQNLKLEEILKEVRK